MPGLAVLVLSLVANLGGDGIRSLLRCGGSDAHDFPAAPLGGGRAAAADPVVRHLPAADDRRRGTRLGPTSAPTPPTRRWPPHGSRLGLDDPMLDAVRAVPRARAHGDLGRSLRTRQPVTADLATSCPATANSWLVAFVLALLLGRAVRPVGRAALAGRRTRCAACCCCSRPRRRSCSRSSASSCSSASSAGCPPGGSRRLPGPRAVRHAAARHACCTVEADAFGDALQASAAARPSCSSIAPPSRSAACCASSLASVLGADHVRTARSKGLTETRGADPATSSATRSDPGCPWPGCSSASCSPAWSSSNRSSPGRASATTWPQSIPVADFPAIAGVTLVLGAIYIISNAVVDLLQARRRPAAGHQRASQTRTRHGRSPAEPTASSDTATDRSTPVHTNQAACCGPSSQALVAVRAAVPLLAPVRAAPAPSRPGRRGAPTDGVAHRRTARRHRPAARPRRLLRQQRHRDHDQRLRGPGAVQERHRHRSQIAPRLASRGT